MVDLKGRLSNPLDIAEALAAQGPQPIDGLLEGVETAQIRPSDDHAEGPREEKGRHSNPPQRRLSPAQVDQIVTAYLDSTTSRQICRELDMHRTTVDNCLKRVGAKQPRQPVLTETDIDEAEAAYLAGESWATIARRFDVDPATIGRLLKLRGEDMRPRRGGRQKADTNNP
jgi:transposase-like protein